MILHNLRSKVKISIGIDVKVEVCDDLDSDGVSLALLNNVDGFGKFCFNFRKGFDIDSEVEAPGRFTQFLLGKKIG